jgi:hypothetical protein
MTFVQKTQSALGSAPASCTRPLLFGLEHALESSPGAWLWRHTSRDDRNINRPTVMSGLVLGACQIFHNPLKVFQ